MICSERCLEGPEGVLGARGKATRNEKGLAWKPERDTSGTEPDGCGGRESTGGMKGKSKQGR